jgi:hypothetical protein
MRGAVVVQHPFADFKTVAESATAIAFTSLPSLALPGEGNLF